MLRFVSIYVPTVWYVFKTFSLGMYVCMYVYVCINVCINVFMYCACMYV